ncbi:MAG: SAM-dependent methyltransferase [Deltaproteobacteria bacterium]|jgi:SAM-dependent methyltransferase|nr:SAM-dependent methyltransferase [Deltaproteobacteria bacterium]MBW2529881.1 SAM-dependent methyltransferase [Deltaproteobacteria bacterium]
MTNEARRAGWAAGFQQRVEAHWTRARLRSQFGDKKLLLPPVEAGTLLRALGLLRGDGSMSPQSVRKYLQVSHMVGLLEPLLLDLAQAHDVVRVLDAGCGRSYLALLIAWCFENRYHHPVEVLGVDHNPQLIETCRQRAPLAGVERSLRFVCSRIADLDVEQAWQQAFGTSEEVRVHGLVALHACDTATDEALALGVGLGATMIAAAPCCHAELARTWSETPACEPPDPWAPVRRSPHLRREAAATMTDAMRTLLLRGAGYDVTAMEFVPSEHTPKNTLLRAMLRGDPDAAALDEYVALREALGGGCIRLEQLLPAPLREQLAGRCSL